MDTSCYLCSNPVEGPEAVCSDCLNLLPSPSKIKQEIQEFQRETPNVQWWEWDFLNDHLPTTSASETEKDEEMKEETHEEMNEANEEDDIFWSDTDTSDDSGYQSPHELSLSQPDEDDSKPWHWSPAHRTDEDDSKPWPWSPAHRTDEDDSKPWPWSPALRTADVHQMIWDDAQATADKLISQGISFHSG